MVFVNYGITHFRWSQPVERTTNWSMWRSTWRWSSQRDFLSRETNMRRAYRKIWRAVPCTSRQSLRTDSWKDIEEILKSKLATIIEEPETCEENQTPPRLKRLAKKGKKKGSKDSKAGNFLLPHFSLRDSYALFMSRFASKGSFGGLLQYWSTYLCISTSTRGKKKRG